LRNDNFDGVADTHMTDVSGDARGVLLPAMGPFRAKRLDH